MPKNHGLNVRVHAVRYQALAAGFSLLWAMALISCGTPVDTIQVADPGIAILEYSAGSESLVLSYNTTGGMIASSDTTPLLRIYGDGRALIHFPKESRRAGDYVLQLSEGEMLTLLSSISEKGVMTFDAEALREDIKDSASAGAAPRAGAVISDGVTMHIVLQLARYRPAGSSQAPTVDFRKTISWYALGASTRQYPDAERLKGLAEAEGVLIALMMRDDLVSMGL